MDSGLLASLGPGMTLSFAARERQDALGENLRLLLMREMPGALDRFEARARDHRAIGATIGLAEHAVVEAPEKQRRDADAMQPAFEPRIVEVRVPGEPRGGL